MSARSYGGPIGIGSTFQRGDVTIRIVGDFDQRQGKWPYEVIRVGGREVPPGGRRRISGAKLRREFEPAAVAA
jgi:hypothetical protein